jgi:hypothetical protein
MNLNIKEELKSFAVDVVLVNVFKVFGINIFPDGHHGSSKTNGKDTKVSEALRSAPGGRGMTDEVLFAEACCLAMREGPSGELAVAEIKDIMKICRVFKTYDIAQRKRIVQWIGFDEVDVGDPKNKDSVSYNNVRGRRIIELLAKMNERQIRDYLKASHVTDTATDEAVEFFSALDEKIGKGIEHLLGISSKEVDNKLNRMLARERRLLKQGK